MKRGFFGVIAVMILLTFGVSNKTYAWGYGRGGYHARGGWYAPRVRIAVAVPPVVVGGYYGNGYYGGGYAAPCPAPYYGGGYYAPAPVYRGYYGYAPRYNGGYERRGYDRGGYARGGYSRGGYGRGGYRR